MQTDYTLANLQSMPREELETFSMRMLHRLVPEESASELFTFDAEETENEERLQAAKFDAMLRLHAIALSELPALFGESNNAQQNIVRMSRLLLWHFYAVSFNLEKVISLETHCNHVEVLLKSPPSDAFGWVKALTELLHQYAELNQPK